MTDYTSGDRVRIDIPDKQDPDHDRYHRQTRTIVKVLTDDAGQTTGDERDSTLYRVKLDDGDTVDVRWRDLRPAPNS